MEQQVEKVKMYKRIIAYVIDIIIVTIVASAILLLFPKNPNYRTISDNTLAVQESLRKGQLSSHDYIIETIKLTYDTYKFGIWENVTSILVLVLYFALFTYFNKGRTLGKMIMGIEVKDKSLEKPKLWSSFVRSFIITRGFGQVITIILVFSMSKKTFTSCYNYVDMGLTMIWIACAFVSMFREDGRGLHDLIAGTIVVGKRKRTEEVVEAKIEEKKETKKVTTTKKSTNKTTKKNNKKK